jgi:hypothetical protein
MISQYWINQIPARPLVMQVKNEQGQDLDLSAYTDISIIMIGSDNEPISLSGSSLNTTLANIGKLTFSWPTDRSLFKRAGEYVLQVQLKASDRLDFTTTHMIRVRELGRTYR